MVSYQLESDVEVSPRPTRGINVVAMASMSQVLNFFDLLYCIVDTKTKPWHDFVFSSLVLYEKEECGKFRVRCRVLTRFMFEVNVVAMASMSQTQFQKEYKKFEVRCRVLTRFTFEVNVVAMASMSRTQSQFTIILKERFKICHWFQSQNPMISHANPGVLPI